MIEAIDHVVLTVSNIDGSVAFYARVLGMQPVTFAGGRKALMAGTQKINLQTLGQERRNRAAIGSGDLCLLTKLPPEALVERLTLEGVAILEGPVARNGALGPITSVYFNDPDGNLVEVSSYDSKAP